MTSSAAAAAGVIAPPSDARPVSSVTAIMRVVSRGVRERLPHQLEPELERRPARPRELLEHRRVVGRIDDHQHVAEVLGRRAHAGSGRRCRSARPARRTACRRRPPPARTDRGSRRRDRRLDAVSGERLEIVRRVAAREDAAVDLGCRVLTRPSIISGKPVTSETSVTGSPASARRLGRAAGRDQLDAERRPDRWPSSTRPVLSETLRIARISA